MSDTAVTPFTCVGTLIYKYELHRELTGCSRITEKVTH